MQPNDQEKMFAAIAHASGIATMFVGPLVVWFLKKEESAFVAYHAIQAAVFNIVAWIAFSIISTVTCGFGAILFPVLWLVPLFWAYKAYNGSTDGYPALASIGRPPELL